MLYLLFKFGMELNILYIFYAIVAIILLYLLRIYFKGPRCIEKKDVSNKVIIITGSSSGIGKAHAFNLLENGATVIFACRDEKKTIDVINETLKLDNKLKSKKSCNERAFYLHLNLNSFASVQKFANDFKKKFDKLDILVNNAGFMATKFDLTEDGLESMLQSNHYSHVLLTYLLLDFFNKNEARVINLSSSSHSLSNFDTTLKEEFSKESGGQYKNYLNSSFNWLSCYGNSKLCNIYFTQHLSGYLSSKYSHIRFYSCHPGNVNSDFANKSFGQNTIFSFFLYLLYFINIFVCKNNLDGAQTQLKLCYEDTCNLKNGAYYSDCCVAETGKIAQNKYFQDYVMRIM